VHRIVHAAVRSEIARKNPEKKHAEYKWVNDTRYQLISNGN